MARSSGKGDKKRKRRKKADERPAKLIRALDHGLRRRILRVMNEAGGPISPVKVGKLLNASLGNVSYHINLLRDLGAVELKSLTQVRGAMEHFYIATTDDNKAIMALLEETREADEVAA